MLVIYNFCIQLYHLLIITYQLFNTKAKQWIDGRKHIFKKISHEVNPGSNSIWFHFASLGEFEQGRPVLEHLRMLFPEEKIIVTFFSPSGYELRKNYKLANHIFYLPLDTNKNAEKFVKLINPKIAIFTKYEYWYHYFYQLNSKKVPIIVISSIFRERQAYFKWYGNFNRKILRFVNHFFVQDANSKELLESINISDVTVSGDTRFDRVKENTQNPTRFMEIETFCKDAKVFIAGSTWPQDEKYLATLIKQLPDWKFVIAPHEINEDKIASLIKTLSGISIQRYSAPEAKGPALINPVKVLIIDNMGILSSLYQYGQIAYIGGGFGVGIHNTLEAAAFGIPVIFGPNYIRFREAVALVKMGAAFTINNSSDLHTVMKQLEKQESRTKAGLAGKNYVESETGATEKIIEYLKSILH
ncbi:MAG: 3-deoxy-D-manno-octulosonic acid transferase [Pyrinomonadaceae bacterium]|nr:3-deoxy-D-manno-octulosonic acid transferase [Sphingobacteriaceae bacterium]